MQIVKIPIELKFAVVMTVNDTQLEQKDIDDANSEENKRAMRELYAKTVREMLGNNGEIEEVIVHDLTVVTV